MVIWLKTALFAWSLPFFNFAVMLRNVSEITYAFGGRLLGLAVLVK